MHNILIKSLKRKTDEINKPIVIQGLMCLFPVNKKFS